MEQAREPRNPNVPAPKSIEEKIRPGLAKRLLAPLFDIVLIFFSFYAIYTGLISTPMADPMRGYEETMQKLQDDFKLETGYGAIKEVEAGSSQGNYIIYPPDERYDGYYIVENVQFESEAERTPIYEAYLSLLDSSIAYHDAYALRLLHNYAISLLAGFIAELLVLFILPLVIPPRATPGMAIFRCHLIGDRFYSKPKWYQLLGRFLFVYFIESAIPYYFLGQYTVLVVPPVLFVLAMLNKKHKSLHDYASRVMIVETALAEEELQ